jgi:hypothetical protein
MADRRCNEPGKHRFRDRIGAALFAATRTVIHGQLMEPYQCPAGHWHIRTVAKRASRRGRGPAHA